MDKIYVALDLGSESMAAYYADAFGTGGMIKLQESAPRLLGLTKTQAESEDQGIDFLEERPTGGITKPIRSPRMLNRISFNDGKQPRELKPVDATLIFHNSNDYNQALFRHFHQKGAWPPGNGKIMPNPKILFQHQVKDILPLVESNEYDTGSAGPNSKRLPVDLSPRILINHLSLQIIVNFILNSDELRSIDRKLIDLTITIPNVYSLPHAESIKRFVRDYSGIPSVEVLSESDAVAYYVLATEDMVNDPKELREFKAALDQSRRKRKKLCLVTVDVGKGTTDLSCILMEEPKAGQKDPEAKRLQHSVQGKTGKSTGGNHLNYIFASYYDRCLEGIAGQLFAETQLKLPFGFLSKAAVSTHYAMQGHAVVELEKLIEEVKRSINEKYDIEISEERQRALLGPVIAEILKALPAVGPKAQALERIVTDALVLPRELGHSAWDYVVLWRKSTPERARTAELKAALVSYVTQNIDQLFDSLKHLVKERQAIFRKRAEIDRHTFVVVSGQASQLKPLQNAIRRKCGKMRIKRNQRYFMDGVRAKEACCRGVVSYKVAKIRHINQHELHGTYGCLAATRYDFKAFDPKKIQNEGRDKISFDTDTTYYLVFTPRSYKEVLRHPPKKNDGSTALIDVLDGCDFSIQYKPDQLELSVNEKELELKTFGSVDGSIYPKVWPEILSPSKD